LVTDESGEPVSIGLQEHLAVAEVGPPLAGSIRVEDRGARDDWASQRAAASFIDAGDDAVPLLPGSDLSIERWHRAELAHRARC
jgi:hypothetical protein